MPRLTASKSLELEAFWRAHLDGWRRNDLNQREYCELHGLLSLPNIKSGPRNGAGHRGEGDLTFPQNWPCHWRIFVQGEMRAGAVVVVGVGGKHAAQMRCAKDDHVIQAFVADRSDQALDAPILPRRPRGSGSVSDAHSSEAPPEDHSIDTIAIAYEVLGRRIPRKRLGNLPRDPVGRRAGADGDVNQPAPVMA